MYYNIISIGFIIQVKQPHPELAALKKSGV